MNILAIGAHPDDIELGCGGTILKAARQGHNVYMYVLTRGSASGDPIQRCHELMESAKYVGAKALWIDNFPDTKLVVANELINHIEYFIRKSDAQVIFTHSGRDTHHDHRAIAERTIEAARFSQNIFSYEIPVTKDFDPQVFYDISDVIDEKLKLIKLFWSQQSKLFTKADAIKGLAQYRALQSRLIKTVSSVESFEVLKMCFSKDFTLAKYPAEDLPKAVQSSVNLNDIIEYQPSMPTIENMMIESVHQDATTPSMLATNAAEGRTMTLEKRMDADPRVDMQ
jgi:LmbE family N-acetylglucosaminyl deacetylase